MSDKVLLLVTSLTGNPIQEATQRKIRTSFQAKKIVFDELDAMLPENRDRRNELFEKSGLKGKFPQAFIISNAGLEFVGDGEKLNELLELDDLPAEVLDANPGITNFTKTFANCQKSSWAISNTVYRWSQQVPDASVVCTGEQEVGDAHTIQISIIWI